MKIALILFALNSKGGTQRQAIQLAKHLKNFGHEVFIHAVFYYPENSYKELLDGISVNYLFYADKELMNKILLPIKIPIISFILIKIKKIIFAKKIVQTIKYKVDLINIHDFFQVCFYAKRIKKVPIVYTYNDIPYYLYSFVVLEKNVSFIKKFIFNIANKIVRFYLSFSDKIIVLDNQNRLNLKKYFNLDSEIVRSGTDPNKFDFCPRQKITSQKIKILTVNILAFHRRIEDIILAMEILKNKKVDTYLTIVGNRNENEFYAQYLDSLINRYNLNQKIKFLNNISDDDLNSLYKESDIFIYPNHNQTWGLAVFEAMATGLPVIVSKTTGVAEVLQNEENALIVESKSPEKIADAILKLIDNSFLYQKLSFEGRKLVIKKFNWHKYAQNVENVFLNLIKNYSFEKR